MTQLLIILVIVLGTVFIFGLSLFLIHKFYSNERKSVRKHEGKRKICPKCKGEAQWYDRRGKYHSCEYCSADGYI